MKSIEQMILEFRRSYPKRKIIYLDKNGGFKERTCLNLDILKGSLGECALKIEYFENKILLSLDALTPCELMERLLFRCAIIGEVCDDGVFLLVGGDTCDIMSVACRLLEEFKK